MPNPPPSKPYNGGQWTEARMRSFIKSALRQASLRWPPRNRVRVDARVERGKYRCAGYKRKSHIVPASIKVGERRVNNAVVDHIDPVIPLTTGFSGWDEVIKRMFCEADNLQILCHECHKNKTDDERKKK